jgi:hypothetical protein
MLAGLGTGWLVKRAYTAVTGWRPKWSHALVGAGLLVIGVGILTPVWRERASYDHQSASWINIQRQTDATSGRDFTALAEEAEGLGGGRVFAGSAASQSNVKVGYVPGYTYLLNDDVDAVGFTLRTLSLSDDVETRFDPSNPAHYDLYNVRYVILPTGEQPTVEAHRVSTRGQWALWEVPTGGYLRVVDTTPAIVADRTNLGQRVNDFLGSSAPADGKIPVIAFGGDRAAAPTEGIGQPAAGSPGDVSVQFERPDDGVFGGTIDATRPAVVMLKATYHPRWTVTVDAKPAKTEMIAPSFVGVRVPAGQHTVEFRYEPYPDYWLLFLIGFLTLVALAVVPRWWARRTRSPRGDDGDGTSDGGDDEPAPTTPPEDAVPVGADL